MPKIVPPCKVWQWDINDTVTVEGIEDISKWQVHFASTGDSNALVLEINPDMTCYIPNQLVELGQAIYAYLYNVREERAYTETAILIPVGARPKPSDYISEPTDVLTWGQLRADIGTLSQLVTEDKTNLVAAINELHGDIETAKTEQDKDITAIQSDIDDIKQDITDINDTDTAQSKAITQAQKDIDELEQGGTQLAESVSSLEQTVDKGFEQISTELDKKQPKGDYITNAVDNLINYYKKTETYTQDEVNALVSGLTHITVQVVNSVADVTQPNIIYLVPTGGTGNDSYDEYLYVNGKPERIGSMRVDLSQYYTKSETYSRAEIDSALSGKQPIGDYATTTALTEGLNTKQPVGNYVTSVNGTTPDEGGNVEIDVQTYTAGDGIDISESGEIAVTNPMNDEQVSAGTTWSSLNIIKRLTQPFSQSGSIITCYPVDGSPLHVVSDITAVQEGEGDPSPENVRPISGWDNAILHVGTNEYSKDFPETVYGGTLDWTTGVLTVTWVKADLSQPYYYPTGGNGVRFNSALDDNYNKNTTALCSHGLIVEEFTTHGFLIGADNNNNIYAIGLLDDLGLSTIEEYKTWAESNTIELYYKTKHPYTIQLTPTQILAIAGLNTIYCDTGDITVTGYEDPRHTVAQLTSRIAALESAAAGI